MIGSVMSGGTTPIIGIAMAAATKPPSTSAPSPPIMMRPMRAGIATASAVNISGAERWSVFWNENAVPKPPRQTKSTKSTGDLPIARRKRAKSAAAMASASSGIATYSELTRSFSAISEPAFRDPVPIRSRLAPVARGAFDMRLSALPRSLRCRAHNALEKVIHLVEERVEIVVSLVDHDLAFVVLERPDIDRLLGFQPFDRSQRRCLRGIGRAGPEWRVLHEIDVIAPGGEVWQRPALSEIGGIALIDRRPFVFRAGDEALRRERRLARIVAAGLDAALLAGLDDHLRPVNMARDDIASGIDQRVRGFCFADWQRPVAGEDHLHGRVRIDRARPQEDRIDVAEHNRDRLRCHEADLVGLRRKTGGDAVHVMRLVEVAEIGAGVFRILVLVPERRRVTELDIWIFFGEINDKGAVVAERGREDEAGAIEVDHRFHRLRVRVSLRHVLFLDHFHARHFRERLDRHRMRLVPAEIVARADIDHADREVLGGERATRGSHAQRSAGQAESGGLQERTSGNGCGHCNPRAGSAAQISPAATQVNGSKDRADPESSRARGVV